jgi:hypothetical protein
MKKTKWFLFVICLCCVITASAQKNRAKLFFKDSTTQVGLAKITKSGKIVFRKETKAKKETYSSQDVYEVHIKKKGFYKRYFYKIDYESRKVRLLQLIKEGPVSLFGDIREFTTYSPYMNGNGSLNPGGGGPYKQTKETYYLCDGDDVLVVNLKKGNTHLNKFLELAKIYFMDCPELITSIENKEFAKYGIRDVVEYYNSYCK